MRALGKVGLANRGVYSASAQYTSLDFVAYNGSTYVALKNVKGVTPSNDGTNWQAMALGTSMSLANRLDVTTAGQMALDAAQGPAITALVNGRAPTCHVKLSNTYASSVSGGDAAGGVAASQNALYNAYANRAPISHAASATTYGQGNASNYGHVKLSDTYASKVTNGAAANGLAASQNALYNGYNALLTKINQCKLLWSHAGMYMHSNQTATLSENIASQPNGIVIRWQGYKNGEAQPYDNVYNFIPKAQGTIGGGVSFFMCASDGRSVGRKYLYISGNTLKGNDHNRTDGLVSDSNIIFTNTHWVMTGVYGI